ncbi:signal-regulatory protein beta-1-like [Emydura macquarii macquarii]|uniref:signal-regulatory protein beta-1-like n=1 Tax=Emydura macquarii macquarii TaxID=1129001 RepID=UPI00352A0DDF
MPLAVAPGLLLLLLAASGARGILQVSIPPPSPVQARPGSDVLLGCHFSVAPASVSLKQLVVQWKRGEHLVAEFDDELSYPREGARLSQDGLQNGNASLLLPRVRVADAGLYTCSIIYTPSQQSRDVELRVEAPPHVSVGSTMVWAGEPSAVTCSVSGFSPSSLRVTWLRDGQVVGGPETPPTQLGPDGLYSANSIYRLVPRIADADVHYSCHVQHVALRTPIDHRFQLSVLAPPHLTLKTVVTPEGLGALQCLVSGYYPPDITVQWLQEGVALPTMESRPKREQDGSFTLHSDYFLSHPETNTQVTFTCHVQHPALITPVEERAIWTVPRHPFSMWLLVVTLLLMVLVVALLWIACYSWRIRMTEIHGGSQWLKGSLAMLYCSVEGRLGADTCLSWNRKPYKSGKEDFSPDHGEQTASLLKLKESREQRWREPLWLGRERIVSVLMFQVDQSLNGETLICTFQQGKERRQKSITVSVLSDSPAFSDGLDHMSQL